MNCFKEQIIIFLLKIKSIFLIKKFQCANETIQICIFKANTHGNQFYFEKKKKLSVIYTMVLQ